MRNIRDIHGLRHYILYVYMASFLVLLFGVISLILFFAPPLLAIPESQHEQYRGNIVWLFAGLFFIAFAAFCIIISSRWSRHLIWIFKNVQAETMKARIEVDESSDSTTYYAIISKGGGTRVWRMSLYNPSWDVRGLVGEEITVNVYLEPKREMPAVVETEHGLLWRMAGKGSAEKLV